MLLGAGGLPPMVGKDALSGMARNSAQEDGARLVPVTPAQVNPGDQQMVQAVERFVPPGELFNYLFQVKISSTLKKPVVAVIDRKTGREICEIPPDTVMQMLSELSRADNGAVVDQTV